MVYDLLFFFIVIIIVLNLIFGVIIDTFADLRSEKQKKEEILKTTCFICGEAWSLSCGGCRRAGAACGLGHCLGCGSLSLALPRFLWPLRNTALGWLMAVCSPRTGRTGPCLNLE